MVTGKGGVGKSTVSAALALCAARRGKKVLVCEINAKERVAPLLGHAPAGPEIKELEPGLFAIDVRPADAMREYALMKLKFETIYNAVFENRFVKAFLRLIPSLAETVLLGKVWFEVEAMDGERPRWDLVIMDAPATGHGITFLRVPQVLLRTIPPGPMRDEAERMNQTLTDATVTSLQIVTLLEEMPVNETLELEAQVRDSLGIPLGALFLNAFVARRFAEDEVPRLRALRQRLAEGELSPETAAGASGAHQADRAEMSAYYRRKLEVEIPRMPQVILPRIYTPEWGRKEVEQLSAAIDAQLETAQLGTGV
ncbi:MAG: chromosome partitioning protein [Deltaproteobacteria bacterium]|nr:MAG: chromosome partitioning protein [Deltaproteobacteria bacterium]